MAGLNLAQPVSPKAQSDWSDNLGDWASGADVMQEPMDQPYGTRDCAFRDPSGNQVRINQRAKG